MSNLSGEKTKQDKRERFVRISTYRVDKILYYIRLLRNCSNKYQYQYSQEDIDTIFTKIDKALLDARIAFNKEKHPPSRSRAYHLPQQVKMNYAEQTEMRMNEERTEEEDHRRVSPVQPQEERSPVLPNNVGKSCKPRRLKSGNVQCLFCGNIQSRKKRICENCHAKFRRWIF